MSKILAAFLCVAAVSAGLAQSASADSASTLAVYGDSPYGTSPTDTTQFTATPAFIQSVNDDGDVARVIHVGDIHSGSQYCTQEYDQSIFDLWSGFSDPLVYTPGDNEWADCHKKKEGGGAYNPATGKIDYVLDANGEPVDYAKGNPVSNLELARSIFFANPGMTIGGSQQPVTSQAVASGNDYVENVMWEQSDTLFVTANIPGGSNNDSDPWYGGPGATNQQLNEVKHRTQADLAWINAAFARAVNDDVSAVVIVEQADMWDLDGKTSAHIANYKPFIKAIADGTAAFDKPVLLFDGDRHVYRSDNPLVDDSACTTEGGNCSDDAYDNQVGNAPAAASASNFHRVTVHGSTTPLEWLKLTVDPEANNPTTATTFGPFSWSRVNP